MNLYIKKVTKKSIQLNGGHLSLVPYCTNQRNKRLCSFLSYRVHMNSTAPRLAITTTKLKYHYEIET